MKQLFLLFVLILFASLACATSTDGNYTLLQFDVIGSGESTLDDENYISFADVGEPVVHQAMTDDNYSAGLGFYGESIVAFITIVEEVAEAAVETIVIILPVLGGSVISIVMLIVIIGFMATILILRRKIKGITNDLNIVKKRNKENKGDLEDEFIEEIS